ncbi:MAG: acetyl-CoA acetyltransferase [Planctomycetota bacterium]
MTGKKVAILGVGYAIPRVATPELSYRELTYEAALKAYDEAGVHPRDIQSFTCCSEDFNEGTSIFDEYVPDQLGAPLKSVHTISGDGLQGLIAAYLQVLTGLFDIAVVEVHSKASNIVNHDEVLTFALDPIFNRPFKLTPHYVAGLEMNYYLNESGNTLEQCAAVVVKNRANALHNMLGVYGAKIDTKEVIDSEKVASPLTALQMSQYADGSVVLVIVSEEKLKKLNPQIKPIWIKGVGWNSETSWLETHSWTEAVYTRLAAEQAYKMAGIKHPAKEIDIFEIDDTYAYKELQHLESLGLCKKGEAGKLTVSGATAPKGTLPVNISGGSLGMGNFLEANGLYRTVAAVLQLRNEAGRIQRPNVKTALVHSWRGIPTTTGAVVILSNK